MNYIVMVLIGFGFGIFIMTIFSMYRWVLKYWNNIT